MTDAAVNATPMADAAEVQVASGFLVDAWRIARKDLLIEFRTRSGLLAATVFSVLAVVIFRFTWDPTAIPATDLAPGVLWVIFTFSGLLGLNRSVGLELADRAYDGLLASPVSRQAVFAGKMLGNLVFVGTVQGIQGLRCGRQTLSRFCQEFVVRCGPWNA